ncbi:MAG TPA: hypothetical protein VK571_05730, partial [Gemmatimonadaceae bacterium]|nr:hypothetical protein [Gemmatimonadaceae bacterium]
LETRRGVGTFVRESPTPLAARAHRERELRELMRNHLKHCATGAIRTGGQQADRMYDELVDLMYTHNR